MSEREENLTQGGGAGTLNPDSQAQQDAAALKNESEGQQQGQEGQQVNVIAPKPNVRLAHGKQPITVPSEAGPGRINIGAKYTIELPDEEAQRAGFYLEPELAALLLLQYQGVYIKYKPLAKPVAAQPQGQQEGQSGNGGGDGSQT